MTIKTVKLQLERIQEENIKLKELNKALEEKIAILEDSINKLKFLNYIDEKYNIPGN